MDTFAQVEVAWRCCGRKISIVSLLVNDRALLEALSCGAVEIGGLGLVGVRCILGVPLQRSIDLFIRRSIYSPATGYRFGRVASTHWNNCPISTTTIVGTLTRCSPLLSAR